MEAVSIRIFLLYYVRSNLKEENAFVKKTIQNKIDQWYPRNSCDFFQEKR